MALREILAKFGFEVDSAKLTQAKGQVDLMTKAVGSLSDTVKTVGLGLVAGLGLGGLVESFKATVQEADELADSALKAGTSLEAFQRLGLQTGLSNEKLVGTFRLVQQQIAAVRSGAGDATSTIGGLDEGLGNLIDKKGAAETFKALGIEVGKAGEQGKDNAAIFTQSLQALAKIQDPAQRAALSLKLFGRGGTELLPVIAKGSDELKQWGEVFDAFGGLTDANKDKLDDAGDQMQAYRFAMRSLKFVLASELAPVVTSLIKDFLGWAAALKKNTDILSLFKTGIVLVTGAMVLLKAESIATAAKSAASWALAALPFALLLLAADDLIHFFKGDARTATEDLITAIFGFEEGKEIIEELRGAMGQWISELTSATSWLDKIKTLLEGIANAGKRLGSLGLQALGFKKETADSVAGSVSKAASVLNPADQLRNAVNYAGAGADLNASGFFSDFAKNFGAAMSRIDTGPGAGAPTVKGGKAGPTNNQVTQTVNLTQNIHGADAQDAADQAKDGVKGVVADERRATMAALDARK